MNLYTIEIDGVQSELRADSLAEVANKVRGKGKRIRVWSGIGILLIDTLYGDIYGLIS